MGGGHGAGYKQREVPVPSNLLDNLALIADEFPLSPNGFFGERVNSIVRRIASDDNEALAKYFYEKFGTGGIRMPLENGRGEQLRMQDLSFVQLRPESSSDGTPVVEIRSKRESLPYQKIHFISIEQAEKEKNAKKNNKA
jgi:hypothetical protein